MMRITLRLRHAVRARHVEALVARRPDVAPVDLTASERPGPSEVPWLIGAGTGWGQQDPAQDDPGEEDNEHEVLAAVCRATPLVDHGWEAKGSSGKAEPFHSVHGPQSAADTRVHSPAMVDIDAEVAPLRAEVERLRRLVGPCEQSYSDLRADLIAARDAAKSAEQAAGELRGKLTEAYAAIDRAMVGSPAVAYLARQVRNSLSGTFAGRAYRAADRMRRGYSAGTAGTGVR
jgi:hypothetical protein